MNIDILLEDMTVEEKVGQLFMLAFSGTQLEEAAYLDGRASSWCIVYQQ